VVGFLYGRKLCSVDIHSIISYCVDIDSKTARTAVVFKSLTMTAEGEPPSEETPYGWDETAPAPAEVFQLWTEVGNGIDKSQTGAFLAGHFVFADPVAKYLAH
jgi:hypothetical protein